MVRRVPREGRRQDPLDPGDREGPEGLHGGADPREGGQARGHLVRRPHARRRACQGADGQARRPRTVPGHERHQVRHLQRDGRAVVGGDARVRRGRADGEAAGRQAVPRGVREGGLQGAVGGVRALRLRRGEPGHRRDGPRPREGGRAAQADTEPEHDHRSRRVRRVWAEHRLAHLQVREPGRQVGALGGLGVRLRQAHAARPQVQEDVTGAPRAAPGAAPAAGVERRDAGGDVRPRRRRVHALLRRARRDPLLPRRHLHARRLRRAHGARGAQGRGPRRPARGAAAHLRRVDPRHRPRRRRGRASLREAARTRLAADDAARDPLARTRDPRVRADLLPARRRPEALPAAPAAGRVRGRRGRDPLREPRHPRDRARGDGGGGPRHQPHENGRGDPCGGPGAGGGADDGGEPRPHRGRDLLPGLRPRRRGGDPQRALLQRDPFHHGDHRRRHRLLRGGDRRPRQRLRRNRRRPALRRAPDDGRGAHPARLRVPRRRRVRRRHAVPRVQAERHPRREERRARVSHDLALVWLAEAAVFTLVVAGILAERPWALGATGAAIVAAGALVRFVPRLGTTLAGAFARRRPAALGAGVVLALALPLALRSSPYWTFVATLALLYVTIGQGLNLQIGTAGVINLAGAAFAGLGGYSVGLLTVKTGWPPWLAAVVALWVAVAVRTLLFVPILKTRGHYLALVTIAFVFIFNILMNNLEFTGGPQGIKNIPTLRLLGHAFTTKPVLAGVELPSHANFYYAALVMAGLTTWVLRRLHDSWLGLALNTLRDDEIAARCCGVSITRGKLLAFSIGNFFIGLGGAFYAVMVGFVSPPDFDFGYSLVMLSVIIIGEHDERVPEVEVGR